MIEAGYPALAAAYLLPALLAALIAWRSAWRPAISALAVALVAGLYLATGLSLPPLLGWPTPDAPPARFRLIAARVQEPDKATHDPGAIYLWLANARDLAGAARPRAYRLAYSTPLHETVANAAAKLQSGMPQLGEFTPGPAEETAVAGDPAAPAAVSPLRFYDMPDPLFPDR